jgi:hypothetical protein
MMPLQFWVAAFYALTYCAFFLGAFAAVEDCFSDDGQLNWRTYWKAIFTTMAMSVFWPVFLARYLWRHRASS